MLIWIIKWERHMARMIASMFDVTADMVQGLREKFLAICFSRIGRVVQNDPNCTSSNVHLLLPDPMCTTPVFPSIPS